MTAIPRGSSWPSGSGDEVGASGNISASLRPQTRFCLCSHVADVDETSLEETRDESRGERSCTDAGVPRRQEGKYIDLSSLLLVPHRNHSLILY